VTTAKYYIPSGRCIQALDFSNPNEDGSVGIIPDSLISEFRTRNGRVVRDGGGISPDVEALPSPLSQIAAELYQRNYFFDFATKYFWSHPAPESPMKFTISEEIYDDFRNYLVECEFNYSTITELSLNELISNAKREKYYELHKDLFTELQNELRHTLDNDLVTFRDEITELLADEIIGRYFYEEGSIQFSLGTDVQVKKAVEILKSADEYKSILQGRAGSILISHEDNVIMPGLRYDHDKGDEKNV
jgi:carboxyl-terminal processing protease